MSETTRDGGRGGETEPSLWWWFSLNRVSGGPAYHPHQHMPCPFFVWYFNITVSILVFIFPLVACLVILPSFRHKNWSSFLVVLLCLGTGFLLTVVYGSSSWLVGETTVNASVGPLAAPVPGKLGVWAGLWHVNLTYETDTIALNERVDWVTRKDLVEAHTMALSKGWPWALVSLTAEFGGEGMAWQGQLGDGIMAAGLGSSVMLMAAMAMWIVWVLLFTVSPELAARPVMFSGIVMTSCSLVYVVIIDNRVPHTLTVAGGRMELHLGFAWWISAALGLCLTVVGTALLLYDMYHPGQLATIFELDFGSPVHRLNHSSWSSPRTISALMEADETYSQYQWPKLPGYFSDSCVASDDEETRRTKMSDDPASKWKQENASTELVSTPHLMSSDKKPFSEALQTPGGDDMGLTLHLSTLGDDQAHTFFELPPETLRRRSPEQPNEQEEPPPPPPSPSSQQRTTPPDAEGSDTLPSMTKNLSNNHSTILVEKHHLLTHASMRTHTTRRSTRSQKFHPRFSIRLSYKSPLKRKSVSLTRLPSYSEMRQESDEESDEMVEWEEEGEDESQSGEDGQSAVKRESITSL